MDTLTNCGFVIGYRLNLLICFRSQVHFKILWMCGSRPENVISSVGFSSIHTTHQRGKIQGRTHPHAAQTHTHTHTNIRIHRAPSSQAKLVVNTNLLSTLWPVVSLDKPQAFIVTLASGQVCHSICHLIPAPRRHEP